MYNSVVVTNTVPPEALHILKQCCSEVIVPKGVVMGREELLSSVTNADALFCTLTDAINTQFIDSAPKLRVIGTMSVGYNHIDVMECRKRNILLGYTPDVLTQATAELTVSLLLATAHKLINKSSQREIKSLYGSTVGIIGLGRIGLQIAKCIKPFYPAKIVYFNPNSRPKEALNLGISFMDFDEILHESDFVLCCCSLNQNTHQIFNKETFSKMKNSAIFINMSRGQTVNSSDLYDALNGGVIFAAGLDVTDPEPLPVNDPLLTLDNCVGRKLPAKWERLNIMAWNPFTRQHSSRTKLLSSSDLSEIDTERAELQRIEKINRKMLQDVKKLQECLTNSSKCQSQMSQSLLALDLAETSNPFVNYVSHAIRQEELSKQMVHSMKTCCLEPSKRYNNVISSWNNALKKWDSLLQDYCKHKDKVEKMKLKEQNVQNRQALDRLSRNLEIVQNEFETYHENLKNDLHSFMEQRGEGFRPSFEAYIQLELNYWSKIEDSFNVLMEESEFVPLQDDDLYKNSMEMKFKEIKKLSIVDS